MPGGGLVPWETVFRTLAEMGYDGTIGLETYNTRLDGRAFVERGLEFLRGLEARFAPATSRRP